MRTPRAIHVLLLAAVALGLVAAPSPAAAGPLTTGEPVGLLNACKPTKAKPYPVVLVHGQAGDYHGMTGVSDRLTQEGYCVYATNYGFVQGGANGQDHLWISGDQISAFIDGVMSKTGAKMVDVVGHSAGTGVLDNYILKKGGASKVHAFVSFGGLHHPYAHLGIPRFADFDVHLPGLLAFGKKLFPNLTLEQILGTATKLFGLPPDLAATVNSPFVKDLFDAGYWNDLHGGPSEPPGTFLRMFTNGRTLPTHDSMPGICYTNIVGVSDFLVGGSTGWQDPTPNIENFLLTSAVTANTHNDMLGDGPALDKMLEGLKKNCGNGGGGVGVQSVHPLDLAPRDADASDASVASRQKEAEDAFRDALATDWGSGGGTEDGGGCAVAADGGDRSAPAGGLVGVVALGLAVLLRRRR